MRKTHEKGQIVYNEALNAMPINFFTRMPVVIWGCTLHDKALQITSFSVLTICGFAHHMVVEKASICGWQVQ